MALPAQNLIRCQSFFSFCDNLPRLAVHSDHGRKFFTVAKSQKQREDGGNGSGKRVWRRRKLTKKDDKLRYKMERIPFLEEQVRNIRESGKIISMDIEKLLLSEENRFDFVNEVAAEATSYIENNRDEYGFKKPILHVLSNRINEAGFHRSEAYVEPDPFKPGPMYLRQDL